MAIGPNLLLELPGELLEHVLSFLPPSDIVHFGRTCRTAYDFTRPSNKLLWRSAFLHAFDDPRDVWAELLPSARALTKTREAGWDWHDELGRRMRVLRVFQDDDVDAIQGNHDEITGIILDTFDTTYIATSRNLTYLNQVFQASSNAERLVHDFHKGIENYHASNDLRVDRSMVTRSMIPRQPVSPDSSKLHVLYGPTRREFASKRSRVGARAVVYDWSITGPDADHGPFIKDLSGQVNWTSLEAIASLMSRNFDSAKDVHLETPTGFRNNLRHLSPQNPEFPGDWAGVSGKWIGTYAFLDYRDLVHYNFAPGPEHGAGLESYEEATGDLMLLDLRLDESEEAKTDPRFRTPLPVCEDLPVLYFSGISRSHRAHTPRISIRGSVSLVPGAREVRWRFLINYAGADQWQLEGVQPGGVRSGGIFGIWTHCDHDENGPIGPFCYYPYSLCENQEDF
ncbi:hypothetical protein BU16DRAFT_622197 [Lophium mytilinum]|uniref:F-box domain-containing protein n=1 Tax=Lophium mytilinum TaxID=390894 RepID=A0A6A6QDY4_9PEZI|nr:hypothetical protein BU16DRAFT_622197 [Lophium mytilinum]